MVRVITEREAAEPMRRLLVRLGLQTRQAFRQADGTMRPTWYESPELWIKRWAGSDSAITLKDDTAGPAELRFFKRVATDTVRTTYRIGHAEGEIPLLCAFWDLGIRRLVAEFHRDRTPATLITALEARYAAMPGCTLVLTRHADGRIEQVLTMERRATR